jgi:hypothetical protein
MTPFAYDMTALSSQQRARHGELGIQLLSLLSEVRELPDGYEFEFPLSTATYAALVEITPLEYACCPFFTINIRLEPDKRLFWRLAGDEGIKQFILAEFAQWFQQ